MVLTFTVKTYRMARCIYIWCFLQICLTDVINPASVEYSTRPIVINKDYSSGIQSQIVLNLIDISGRCDGKLNLSLSALGLDVFIASNSLVETFDSQPSRGNCFYSLVILPSTLCGEMFSGADNNLNTSGQVSVCENGFWGYVNIPPIKPFPHSAVLWIQPNSRQQAAQEMKPATIDQMESLHKVTVVPIDNSLYSSESSTRPRLPSNIPILDSSTEERTGGKQSIHSMFQNVDETLRRQRRSATAINGTRNEEPQPKQDPISVYYQPKHPEGPHVVELYMIVDKTLANAFGGYYDRLVYRVNQIVSLVNGLYSPFNILIVIVRLEIWEEDRVVTYPEHHLLAALADFMREHVKIRHDCLHALLGIQDNTTPKRGDAQQQSLCSYSSCVGYSHYSPATPIPEIVLTMAHELGHNFGLKHDTEDCQCQNCIMATGTEFNRHFQEWSLCSIRDIKVLLEHGMGSCLQDRPSRGQVGIGQASSIDRAEEAVVQVYGSRTRDRARRTNTNNPIISSSYCGNGRLDPGEECDCGTPDSCPVELRSCCDASLCRLRTGSECAGGPCCAVTRLDQLSPNGKPEYRCHLKPPGTVCRTEAGHCDLPEYCDGTSQWCPADVYKADGVDCRTAEGRWSYCVRGGCRDADGWCRVLWGKTGRMGHKDCFRANLQPGADGQAHSVANCGKKRPTPADRWQAVESWPGIACPSQQDAECGRLWCHHRNEKAMLLGMKQEDMRVIGSTEEVCSALVYDPIWPASDPLLNSTPGLLPTAAGSDLRSMVTQDAGMVPDGTRCSQGLCYNGSCVPLATVQSRVFCKCVFRGVCNNLGNCHCPPGFRPPDCEYGGNGGSIDSGPPPPGGIQSPGLIVGVCIFVVLLVPTVVLTACWYSRTGRVCPTSIKYTFETTESGLARPFDRGFLVAFRRCCRKRIWKTDRMSKPSQERKAQNGAASRGDWYQNGHIVGKSPNVPGVNTAVPSSGATRSKGWMPTPMTDQKLNRQHITSHNSPKGNGAYCNGAVHTGDGSKSRGPSATRPPGVTIDKPISSGLQVAFPTRNAPRRPKTTTAVSTFQSTPSHTDGNVRKLVDTAESRLHAPPMQCDNTTGDTQNGAGALTDIPLVSEPRLRTMTYRGNLCPIEEAAMFAPQPALADAPQKLNRTKSLARRFIERSRSSVTGVDQRPAPSKPNLNRSESQRTTLRPDDISQPSLVNTSYNKPLTDLSAPNSASQL